MAYFVVISLLGSGVFRYHKTMKSHFSDEKFRKKNLLAIERLINHAGGLIVKKLRN